MTLVRLEQDLAEFNRHHFIFGRKSELGNILNGSRRGLFEGRPASRSALRLLACESNVAARTDPPGDGPWRRVLSESDTSRRRGHTGGGHAVFRSPTGRPLRAELVGLF